MIDFMAFGEDFCGAFAALGLDNSWDAKAFKKGFKIEMKMLTEEQVVSGCPAWVESRNMIDSRDEFK